MSESAIPLDAETKAAEMPEDHRDELRLWLRLLTCTNLIEAEIRRMLKPGGHYFLMFCSPLYVHRETYITRSTNLLIPYTKETIAAVFRPDAVWGMSRVVDALPSRMPSWLMDPLLALEVATWGRVRQNQCFFINAWGRK